MDIKNSQNSENEARSFPNFDLTDDFLNKFQQNRKCPPKIKKKPFQCPKFTISKKLDELISLRGSSPPIWPSFTTESYDRQERMGVSKRNFATYNPFKSSNEFSESECQIESEKVTKKTETVEYDNKLEEQREIPGFPFCNPEVVQSMDFENISFDNENNFQNCLLSKNILFDLKSLETESPIQTGFENTRNGWNRDIYVSNHNRKYNQSKMDFTSPLKQNRSLATPFAQQSVFNRNHFQFGSFNSVKTCTRGLLTSGPSFGKSKQNLVQSMNTRCCSKKSTYTRNCFYEENDEIQNATSYISPLTNFWKTRCSSNISERNYLYNNKMAPCETGKVKDMGRVFSRNDSIFNFEKDKVCKPKKFFSLSTQTKNKVCQDIHFNCLVNNKSPQSIFSRDEHFSTPIRDEALGKNRSCHLIGNKIHQKKNLTVLCSPTINTKLSNSVARMNPFNESFSLLPTQPTQSTSFHIAKNSFSVCNKSENKHTPVLNDATTNIFRFNNDYSSTKKYTSPNSYLNSKILFQNKKKQRTIKPNHFTKFKNKKKKTKY